MPRAGTQPARGHAAEEGAHQASTRGSLAPGPHASHQAPLLLEKPLSAREGGH